MDITYTITVTRTEHDVPYQESEWKKVVDVPDTKHDELYRYVTTDSVKDVVTQIFQQRVDELDLPKLVVTINQQDKEKEKK